MEETKETTVVEKQDQTNEITIKENSIEKKILDRFLSPGYFDELESWLLFNQRVLNQAKRRSSIPILERLNFVYIANNNLNEFIRTKLSWNKDLRKKVLDQTLDIEKTYDSIRNELYNKCNINILTKEDIGTYDGYEKFLKKEFMKSIYPLLQPLIVRNQLPIPNIDDDASFILTNMKQKDGDITCILKIPESYLIEIPNTKVVSFNKKMENGSTYISSDDVILYFINKVYHGKKIVDSKLFRIYRKINSLNIPLESNYIKGIENELKNRKVSDVMMIDSETKIKKIEKICKCNKTRIRKYPGGFNFLANLYDIKHTPDMVYEKHDPQTPKEFVENESMFDIISKGDVLVHFPYDSFELSTIRLLQEAATDPNVLCIKQTLYRVSKKSKLTKALIQAAKAGKQVTVLLELKAKLDEENNLKLAKELEKAGCQIIFGPTTMKTHAKVLLIVRKESGKIQKYLNISTGNFNEKTAKIYEDISYFTKDTKKHPLGMDACNLFNHLGGFSDIRKRHEMIIAPNDFRKKFEEEINNLISSKSRKKEIIWKCNAFTDTKMTDLIYKAADKGIKVKLIIRGMCIVKPTKNIEIISIVGRYLEHSRVYRFSDESDSRVYIGSGDIMPRNLDNRIEVLIQVYDAKNKKYLEDMLNYYFQDTYNRHKLFVVDGEPVYKRPTTAYNKFNIHDHYFSSH